MDYIKKACDRLGISKTELAKRLNVHYQTVLTWGKAIPTIRLAEICKMSGYYPWELSDDFDLKAIKRAREYFEGINR